MSALPIFVFAPPAQTELPGHLCRRTLPNRLRMAFGCLSWAFIGFMVVKTFNRCFRVIDVFEQGSFRKVRILGKSIPSLALILLSESHSCKTATTNRKTLSKHLKQFCSDTKQQLSSYHVYVHHRRPTRQAESSERGIVPRMPAVGSLQSNDAQIDHPGAK